MNENSDLNQNIIDQDIRDITKKKYLDYAMSVIVDRALPDVRDGLKPVHRRILYAMHQMNIKSSGPYKKSARVVGDVIGKYHPHGDSSVYDAMVRMAQPFSMRALLVDSQGNFGSIDGDSPAAMRYTEARMHKIGEGMFKDINLNTVDYQLNYDGTESEPSVLPVSFPNILINGVQGIAVGMASNIPPHNPIETLNAVKYIVENLIKNEESNIDDLVEIVPAPDFPTGGILHGAKEMKDAWLYGRAKMKLRAKWHEEEMDYGKTAIIIDELPYQVNKANLFEKIVDLATPNQDKQSPQYGKAIVEGIFDVQDESDKDGIRLLIGVKPEYDAELVFNQLIRYTQLETSISYNATVLVDGQPKVLGLLDILNHFIDHRIEVITRRTETLDSQAAKREHMLNALILAIDPNNIEKVISLIRKSENAQKAKESLMELLGIDDEQSQEILNLRLQKLTSIQIDEMKEELSKIKDNRAEYASILNDHKKKLEIIFEETDDQITEFANLKEKLEHYGDKHPYAKRYSESFYEYIINNLASLTKEQECNILMSQQGYLRRIPIEELETQNRGTRGKKKMNLSQDDFINLSVQAHSHNALLFVSNTGKTYSLMAYEIPDLEKGRHIINILETDEDEKIIKIIPVDFESNKKLVMITKNGMIKKTNIEDYKSSFRKGGVIGINLLDNDSIVDVEVADENEEVIMVSSNNKAIRFNLDTIRTLSRNSRGVNGMKLEKGKSIIGGSIANDNGYLVAISKNGLIKITEMKNYRNQSRGGKGVSVMKITERTGDLFTSFYVKDLEQDLLITTKKSIINRISLNNINITNRQTSGVNFIKLDDKDELVDVSYIE